MKNLLERTFNAAACAISLATAILTGATVNFLVKDAFMPASQSLAAPLPDLGLAAVFLAAGVATVGLVAGYGKLALFGQPSLEP